MIITRIFCLLIIKTLALVGAETSYNIQPFLDYSENCYTNLILFKNIDLSSILNPVVITSSDFVEQNERICNTRLGAVQNVHIAFNYTFTDLCEELRRNFHRKQTCISIISVFPAQNELEIAYKYLNNNWLLEVNITDLKDDPAYQWKPTDIRLQILFKTKTEIPIFKRDLFAMYRISGKTNAFTYTPVILRFYDSPSSNIVENCGERLFDVNWSKIGNIILTHTRATCKIHLFTIDTMDTSFEPVPNRCNFQMTLIQSARKKHDLIVGTKTAFTRHLMTVFHRNSLSHCGNALQDGEIVVEIEYANKRNQIQSPEIYNGLQFFVYNFVQTTSSSLVFLSCSSETFITFQDYFSPFQGAVWLTLLFSLTLMVLLLKILFCYSKVDASPAFLLVSFLLEHSYR